MFKVITKLQNSKISSIFLKIRSLHNAISTINTVEIANFTKLSSIWWDEIGEIKPLHAMNKLRVPFIRDCLINRGLAKQEFIDTHQPLKDLTILEVGCGGGILTEPLARLGSIITGIDMNSELIEEAKNHAALDSSLSKLSYSLISIENHVKKNFQKYDVVVASEVIEHVTNKELFLKNCVECLKPGGSIIITTMSKTMMAWFAGKIFAEYIWRFVPPGTHDWNKFITPSDTQEILENYKCTTVLVHGMLYNFITNQWFWTEDTPVSYALHGIKNKDI